jgi:rubredoxin
MSYSLDYFVAAMRCPVCGSVSRKDDSTNMATYIRTEPELAYLGVGYPLKIEQDKMRERGYITVKSPMKNESIKIVHPWECPACGSGNWAVVSVSNGFIKEISSTTLDHKIIAKIHFIHEEVKGVAAALTDRTYYNISDEETILILRKML